MPKRRRVIEVVEGEWLPWERKERWVCCDCSLTHNVEYRMHNKQLELRMFRANRSTAAFRRHQGLSISTKK